MKPMNRIALALLCLCTTLLASAVRADRSEQVEISVAPPVNGQVKESSRQVRKDLQRLVDEGIKSLAPELVAAGTFYPFAAIMGHDNEIRLVGVPVQERAATADQALAALVEKVRQLAAQRRIRATAYFMDYLAQRQDTEVTQPGIRVELNHRQPDAMSAFIPYSITPDKKLRLLTPQYKPGKNLTFGTP